MIKVAEDVKLQPISEGIIGEGVASYYVAPKTSSPYMQNMNNDSLGVVQVRNPIYAFNVPSLSVSSSVHFQPAGQNMRLYYTARGGNQTLKYVDSFLGGAETSYASVFSTGSLTVRFDTIQGNLLMTTSDSTLGIKYTTGSAPASIAGITTYNDTDLISAGFVGRIWFAASTNANNRLYYSDVIPSAGVASTTGGTQFLTINASNGDYITALVKSQQVLYVFTSNGVFRVFNTQSQDTSPISNVGTLSQESVCQAKDGIYFAHSSGFYKLSEGGIPQLISNRISSLLYGQTNGFMDLYNMKAWSANDYVYFGTQDSAPSSGTIIYRYTISTQLWTIYTIQRFVLLSTAVGYTRTIGYTNPQCSLLGIFTGTNQSGTLNEKIKPNLVGGNAFSYDFGTQGIFSEFHYQWETFGSETRRKSISGICIPHSNMAGFDVSYKIDNDNVDKWRTIGTLDNKAVTVFKDFVSPPFSKIKFRIVGSNKSSETGTQASAGVPTIIKLSDLGYE